MIFLSLAKTWEIVIRDDFKAPDQYLLYHQSPLYLLENNYKSLVYLRYTLPTSDYSFTTFGYFVDGPIWSIYNRLNVISEDSLKWDGKITMTLSILSSRWVWFRGFGL